MLVFKFGGASVKDAAGVNQSFRGSLRNSDDQQLLIVVSAMGKMTNAFERLTKAYADRFRSELQTRYLRGDQSTIISTLWNDLFDHPATRYTMR